MILSVDDGDGGSRVEVVVGLGFRLAELEMWM